MCAAVSWKPSGHQMALVISYDDRGDTVVSSTSQVASKCLAAKGQVALCLIAIATI